MSSSAANGTYSPSSLLRNFSISQIAIVVVTIVSVHQLVSLTLERLTQVQLVVRWVARAIYRVYFHPLSKFPGPALHVATRIPQLIALWKGTPHKRIGALHRKYGDVVRVAPDEISIIDPQAWKDAYGHGTKDTPGSNPHKHWKRYGGSFNKVPSLILANDEDHARMRRIFSPAFSDRALKQQEPLFMKYVNLLGKKLQEGLEEDPDRKFDMTRMYNFTTFDIMGDLTFGEPLQMLEKTEFHPWARNIFASFRIRTRISLLMYYPLFWKAFQSLLLKSLTKKRMEHFKGSADRVSKRLEKGRNAEGVDVWDLVLSQPEGKGLTRGEMDSNAGLFMVAGTETTATLVSGLTYLLLKNPEAMQQVTGEVRKTFHSPDEMSIEKVASLPYLNACIKEALRLYPPVVTGMPRMTPADGSTICGQFVPPGVSNTMWLEKCAQLG
jgi:cytochrome P450